MPPMPPTMLGREDILSSGGGGEVEVVSRTQPASSESRVRKTQSAPGNLDPRSGSTEGKQILGAHLSLERQDRGRGGVEGEVR